MNIDLIYTRAEAARPRIPPYIELYKQAAARRGLELRLRHTDDYAPGPEGPVFSGPPLVLYPDAELPDAAIVRTVRLPLTRALEARGVRCYNNSRTAEVCNNKYLTLDTAQAAGIPVLPYRMGDPDGPHLPYPVVLKPLHGAGGHLVTRVSSGTEYRAAVRAMCGEPFLVQAVCSEPGRDVRVYLLGGKVLAAMERVSAGDFRANYSLGGRAFPYRLSRSEQALAVRAAAGLDSGLCGVDFLFHNGGWVLNEIEDVVGTRMLYDVLGLDIVDQYIGYIAALYSSSSKIRE